jgi:hypothetical protein
MEKLQLDSLRKELKFLLPFYQLSQYKNTIQKLGWNEQFPKRIVHSIYFDTIEDDFLYDSIYGISKREKIRLRYYNDFLEAHLERKIKSDLYGQKITKVVSEFNGTHNIALNKIAKEATTWIGHKVFPASHVNYERYYYNNSKTNVRVTLDCNLQSKDLKNNIKRSFNHYFICEVKTGINQECTLPVNTISSRFSKYAFSRVGNDSDY